MKDPTLFHVKNTLTSKMTRGIKNFCSGLHSTSTLNQRRRNLISTHDPTSTLSVLDGAPADHCLEEEEEEEEEEYGDNHQLPILTLEDMITKLSLEEEAARSRDHRSQLKWLNKLGSLANDDDDGDDQSNDIQLEAPAGLRRMSCVNNSDILRSAKDALSQYPRFSLDGRDALYRSSFMINSSDHTSSYLPPRVGKDHVLASKHHHHHHHQRCNCDINMVRCQSYYGDHPVSLPRTVCGQKVAWCKPGVVAKLMGLEMMPVPLSSKGKHKSIERCTRRKGEDKATMWRKRSSKVEDQFDHHQSWRSCCSRVVLMH